MLGVLIYSVKLSNIVINYYYYYYYIIIIIIEVIRFKLIHVRNPAATCAKP